MSIVEPKIDVLLEKTDNDRFLLCAEAAKRADDINEMLNGQYERAKEIDKENKDTNSAVDLARANHNRALSIAFNEIADDEVECDPESIDITKH